MLHKEKLESYIQYCCEIAKLGQWKTKTNPIVGAVLVNKTGDIVAEGYHKEYGGLHAEREAILDAKNKKIADFSALTLVVTLEPCNHYGKQPPCTTAIIEAGIKNVIVGIEDPNPQVSGTGIKRLKEAGINVEVGIGVKNCTDLVADYIYYIKNQMPYITLKVAQSIDGFIARKSNDAKEKYLTSIQTRREVHKIRSYTSVLVGVNTIIADDPILDCRLLDENISPQNIIILDSNLRTPPQSKVLNPKAIENITTAGSITENRNILIAYNENLDESLNEIKLKKEKLEEKGAILIKSAAQNNRIDLEKLLFILATEHKIVHILVEGGAEVFSSFINARLVNKLIIHTAPIILHEGVKAFPNVEPAIFNDIINEFNIETKLCGKDIISVFCRR